MVRDQDEQPANAAEALEHLGRLSFRELSMEDLLQTVADLAETVMPGDPEASVTLLVEDRPATVATTGRMALALDESQYDRGHGPCLHAARTGEPIEITDTRTETRWPDYVQRAVEHGNLSSLSIPLAIDEDGRATATRFGPYAAVAAGNLYAYRSARRTADDLQAALESRAAIDQAKGVLMERYKIAPDQAFQLLTQASMNANRKVRDIAEHLVHTGELPAVTPRGDRRWSGPGRPGPVAP